jgi:hypothetical protein
MRTFLEEVKFGMTGGYKGIFGGMPRFDKFINNIQKSTYYLLGAQPKTGKTAILDHHWVLQPYLTGNKNINWTYFSYEIDRLEKMAKYCAYFMMIKHGIIVDSNTILSRGEKKLSESEYLLVEEIYKNEIIDLFGEYDEAGRLTKKGRIDFHQEKTNPTGIFNYMMAYAEKNGTFETEDYETKDETGKTITKKRIIGYKENNPDLYTIIILDHIGLAKKERGFTKKENIDKLSEYFVFLRNLCKFTIVVVSQFNRDLGKVDRLKFSGEDLQPTREDFKDSGNTVEDASMVLAMFNPTLYPHIKKHLSYDLSKIGKSYRSLHILDSRNTESNVNLGILLTGENGFISELPPSMIDNKPNLALNEYYK